MKQPAVSVIIPAYNAEATIAKTLEAVLCQKDFVPGEIVVVDDGSTDKTAQIVRSFQDRNVRYIFQNNAGPAAARNHGARSAAGEWLFFTDADCLPHSDWLAQMAGHFDESDVAVVAGSYGIANPGNRLARCVHKEILYRHKFLMPLYPKVFGSYNFCIRKNVFEKVGGFDQEYLNASGEDNDLSYKVLKSGYRILFERNSLVDHYHPTSARKYLFEQFRHGFWRAKMYLKHKGMLRGDDYTFWKDIVEPGLVMGVCLSSFGALFHPLVFAPAGLGLLTAFVILEIGFGWLMTGAVTSGIYYGGIMFLRAFARTFGFLKGLVYLLPVAFRK